jgi:hypothetical protein
MQPGRRTTGNPERGWRDRVRAQPVTRHVWRVGIFVSGLACIAGGIALGVLPGPLTIPPVLLGLWLWSTEFEWAHRFLAPFQEKGREAWENAKKHPVSATVVTTLGLAAAGALAWAVHHFRLVEQVRDYLGF